MRIRTSNFTMWAFHALPAKVPLEGIEPSYQDPESYGLSISLQGHYMTADLPTEQ